MTRLLILGYVWPEPNSSAAGTRIMELMSCFLDQGWQVHFASAASPTDYMADLDGMGVTCSAIEINNASFDRYVADLKPDVVMFDRYITEEQFGWRVEEHCPDALRLIDTEDLHSLRHARHQAHKQNRPVTKSDLFGEMAQREIAAIYRSDLTLMISDNEMELLQKEFGVNKNLLHHCPFMLDGPLDSERLPSFEQRQDFISIGNFRHAPNWDAVLWLKQTIWPAIRALMPKARLNIYGAYATDKVMALHAPAEGFHVLGRADNAHDVMKSARINLAPLRFGAGIKGKLIDGMVCGTPSVATTIAAEAMSGGLPWGGLIADDWEKFANDAVRLYQDARQWQQAQRHGFDIIEQVYNRQRLSKELIERIQSHRDKITENRLANFTGAMLRHHHHRSTLYMSRWIEAKNRLKTIAVEEQDNTATTIDNP